MLGLVAQVQVNVPLLFEQAPLHDPAPMRAWTFVG
jgi:hypothetical protein